MKAAQKITNDRTIYNIIFNSSNLFKNPWGILNYVDLDPDVSIVAKAA